MKKKVSTSAHDDETMKYLPVAMFLMAFLFGDLILDDERAKDEQTEDKDSDALYLHFFSRTTEYSFSGPPIKPGFRFRDVPDIPSQPIEIPPSAIVSFRVEPGDAFDVQISGPGGFTGMISQEEQDTFQVELNCINAPQNHFKGEVALDEIFAPRATEGRKPAIDTFRVVLSRSKDVEPFLKLQAKIDAGEAADIRVTEPNSKPSKDQPDLSAGQDSAVETKPQSNGDELETVYLHYFRPVVDNSSWVSPPMHLMTIKIHAEKPAEVIGFWSSKVSPQGNGYAVEIKGDSGFADYQFSGNVGLDEVFDLEFAPKIDKATPKWFFCRMVLSKSRDFEPILKAAAEVRPVKAFNAPVNSDKR